MKIKLKGRQSAVEELIIFIIISMLTIHIQKPRLYVPYSKCMNVIQICINRRENEAKSYYYCYLKERAKSKKIKEVELFKYKIILQQL